MGISINGCTSKWMVYNRKSYSNWWFGGTPWLRKPPYDTPLEFAFRRLFSAVSDPLQLLGVAPGATLRGSLIQSFQMGVMKKRGWKMQHTKPYTLWIPLVMKDGWEIFHGGLNGKISFRRMIFHCYVWLPAGTPCTYTFWIFRRMIHTQMLSSYWAHIQCHSRCM